MKPIHRTIGPALVCLPFVLMASCASPKTMKQYQDELRALREERTQLKKENRDLRTQNESFEASMVDATAKPVEPDLLGPNPELDKHDVDYYTDRFGNSVFSVSADVTFASGKAELTKKGKEALQAVARELNEKHADGSYWIEGHTDSDPIKKSKWESNRDLSVERAMAVLHYLVEDCGVPDESCVVAGHGQYAPLTPNEDNGSKARNRRVEIIVRKQS